MDVEPKAQICDSHQTLSHSAVSQRSIDIEVTTTKSAIDKELAKKTMKLDLTDKTCAPSTKKMDKKRSESLDKKGVKSPKSPLTNSSGFVKKYMICIYFIKH